MVSERRLRHRELCNEGKQKIKFGTGDIVVVSKKMRSIRKEGVDHKLVLRAKRTYRVLDNTIIGPYWMQKLPFCESIGSPGRN